VTGALPPASAPAEGPGWLPIVRRVLGLLVSAVALYFVLPVLTEALAQFPQVTKVGIGWLIVVVGCEAASFVMVWMMLRIALGTKRWLPVATSQLAGNSLSSVVPAGAAAGAGLQLRMLSEAGIETGTAASGMTAFAILQFATIGALPLLTIPALVTGGAVTAGLRRAIIIGIIVTIAAGALAVVIGVFDRPLRALGSFIAMIANKLRRKRPPISDLPDRLIAQRDRVRRELGERWREAVLVSVGRVGFDYLALVASVGAVGARVRPSLLLIAYITAVLLALIPITPGGLGFVEAGLAGTLTLAGVDGAHAVLATLIYRLAEYWLPLLIGPFAYVVFRVSQRQRVKPATTE
jgi:uncharacterized protein (TIRG00374 family)